MLPDFEKMRDMSPDEKTKYFQQLLEQQRKAMEEQEAIAMQQALGANDEQWKVIEPRLKKVKHYREQAFIGTKPPFQSNFSNFNTGPGGGQGFGGFSGGFQFQAGNNLLDICDLAIEHHMMGVMMWTYDTFEQKQLYPAMEDKGTFLKKLSDFSVNWQELINGQ